MPVVRAGIKQRAPQDHAQTIGGGRQTKGRFVPHPSKGRHRSGPANLQFRRANNGARFRRK